MAIYEITAPDGKTYEVQGNGTEAEALAHFKSNYQAPQTPEVVAEPSKTVPFQLGNRTFEVPKITSPAVATLAGVPLMSGIGEITKGVGALTQLAFPETGGRIIKGGQNLVSKMKDIEPISATGGQIGSYILPATALSSALRLGLGASLAGRVGSEVLSGGALGYGMTPGSQEERLKEGAINAGIGGALPMLGAGIKAVVPEILGLTTGAGSESIKQGYRAGKEGGDVGKMFAENLRKLVPQADVLESVSSNLTKMGQDLSSAYRSGMVNIKNDKSILDLTPIQQSLKDANDAFKFKGQTKNAVASEQIDEANKAITKWSKLDPAEYHTPEGLDALKQQIGGILENIDFKNTAARKAVGDIYSSIKTTINNQAPEYSKVMKDYHEGLDIINEIKRTFSQTGKAATDTQLRKLQSLTRNNVSTNYGSRLDQMKALETQGGTEVMPALAGQALNSAMPRGLVGRLGGAGYVGGAALLNPMAVPAALMASPRLMGEAAYYTGKASGLMPPGKNAQDLARALMLQQTTQGTQP
jgi:hypothetical protein